MIPIVAIPEWGLNPRSKKEKKTLGTSKFREIAPNPRVEIARKSLMFPMNLIGKGDISLFDIPCVINHD